MCEDQAGTIWVGTSGAGAGRLDGHVIQTMNAADGLAGNMVQSFCACHGGYVWIRTNAGLTCYRPPAAFPPPVFIDAIVAGRRYESEIEPSVGLVAFEFHGMSFKTMPKSLLYRCRLSGFDDDWRPVRDGRIEYQDLPPGDYTFEVVAIDRDLVYSREVASRTLTVTADTRDEQIDELEQRVRQRTRAREDRSDAVGAIRENGSARQPRRRHRPRDQQPSWRHEQCCRHRRSRPRASAPTVR